MRAKNGSLYATNGSLYVKSGSLGTWQIRGGAQQQIKSKKADWERSIYKKQKAD